MSRILTEKQEKFISGYIKNGGNATAAAREAGYAGDARQLGVTGSQLLRKPHIAEAVNRHRNALRERLALEEDYEERKLIEVINMAMYAEEKPNLSAAVSALNLLAELRGKKTKKIQVGVVDNVAEYLEALEIDPVEKADGDDN